MLTITKTVTTVWGSISDMLDGEDFNHAKMKYMTHMMLSNKSNGVYLIEDPKAITTYWVDENAALAYQDYITNLAEQNDRKIIEVIICDV